MTATIRSVYQTNVISTIPLAALDWLQIADASSYGTGLLSKDTADKSPVPGRSRKTPKF